MAHIKSIGAGIYTELHYSANTAGAATDTATEFQALFNGTLETEVLGVRDFPAFGTPANIVNVPAYGQAQSSQVAGQADAPTLEFTLNYNPAAVADGGFGHAALQALAGTTTEYAFRIRLANGPLGTVTASTEHDDFFIRGTIASFQITPSLTDSNQATVTIATAGDYVGPVTTS